MEKTNSPGLLDGKDSNKNFIKIIYFLHNFIISSSNQLDKVYTAMCRVSSSIEDRLNFVHITRCSCDTTRGGTWAGPCQHDTALMCFMSLWIVVSRHARYVGSCRYSTISLRACVFVVSDQTQPSKYLCSFLCLLVSRFI